MLRSAVPTSLEPKLAQLKKCDRGGLWLLNHSLLQSSNSGEIDAQGCPIWHLDGDIPPGPYDITLSLDVDDLGIEWRTGSVKAKDYSELNEPTLGLRKARSIELMLHAQSMDPSTAWLSLCMHKDPDHAVAVIEALLPGIEAHDDCSDFNLITLVPIWRDYRQDLPRALATRLKTAILSFRYWLDRPGNDVMWFWSENHVLCFHTCHLLAADALPEIELGDVVSRLHRWFDSVLAEGLAEWNSAAYYPIDLLALFALRDFGPDPTLAKRSSELLDQIFVMMALHSTNGVPAGSQGRAYEKELLAGPANELGPVAAIAFGGPFVSGFDRAAALFALSTYEPPSITNELARPVGTLEAAYKQGADQGGRLNLWKSDQAQLSSAGGLEPGSKGHQQHVIDLQFAHSPAAKVWINAAGDSKPWGNRRPSFLAGNAVIPAIRQFGPSAMMIYQGSDDLCINAYLGSGHIEIGRRGHWLHLHAGAASAYLWCSSPLHDIGGSIAQAHDPRIACILTMIEPMEQPIFDMGSMSLKWLDHRLEFHAPADTSEMQTWPEIAFNGGNMRPWRDINAKT